LFGAGNTALWVCTWRVEEWEGGTEKGGQRERRDEEDRKVKRKKREMKSGKETERGKRSNRTNIGGKGREIDTVPKERNDEKETE
jgi:hypothetical protein